MIKGGKRAQEHHAVPRSVSETQTGARGWRKVNPAWRRAFRRYAPRIAGGFLLLVIAAQLVYPTNRTLPFARVANEPYGLKTHDQVDERLRRQFQQVRIAVRVEDETVARLSLAHIGARYQEELTIRPVTAYPWWQRLIPFSSVVLRPSVEEFAVSIDKTTLQNTIEKQHEALQRAPRQATIKIVDGTASIVPERPGAKVEQSSLQKAVIATQIKTHGVTRVEPEVKILQPTRSTDDIQELFMQTKDIVRQPLQLKYAQEQLATVSPDQFGAWLVFVEDDTGRLTIQVDSEKVTQYLKQNFAKAIEKPAGVTTIKTLDGKEVARVNGATGRGIDGQVTAQAIEQQLVQKNDHTASVVAKPIPPRKEYDRHYTATPRGVAAYAKEMAESGSIAIAVTGPGGSGYGKADQSRVAASTYKLFVAVMLLHKIEAKEINYDDSLADTSVRTCLERMIVESNNPCAEAFIEKLGRSNLNEFFYARGYSEGTTFTDPVTAKTTAKDLLQLLGDIEKAEHFTASSRGQLLSLMKRQQFRQGVPAGATGTVANKVGFLNGVLNDAAIVSHPRGKYRIVILTDGQSWQKIAEITKQLEALMYP